MCVCVRSHGLPGRDGGQILITRPAVSGKGPGPLALQKIIPTKLERSDAGKVFVKRKESAVCVDRLSQRESPWIAVAPSWQFELLLWGISSGFLVVNHSDLPGSQSTWGISQDLPMCEHTFLSQDGFYCKGLWVEHHSPLTSKEPFCTGVVGEVSWPREWELCGLEFNYCAFLLFP